jgi:hypothetical protein
MKYENLDILYLAKQVRQNHILKEMMFSKINLSRLEENYKNVVDPRKGYENGIMNNKKTRMTSFEKKLATIYIANEESDSDTDEEENKI